MPNHFPSSHSLVICYLPTYKWQKSFYVLIDARRSKTALQTGTHRSPSMSPSTRSRVWIQLQSMISAELHHLSSGSWMPATTSWPACRRTFLKPFLRPCSLSTSRTTGSRRLTMQRSNGCQGCRSWSCRTIRFWAVPICCKFNDLSFG